MNGKIKWLNHINTCHDPMKALNVFCHNYYYFSLNQVLAFSKLIALISPFDHETLAILAQTVFDELGCGDPDAVHSILFARFMMAVGVNSEERPSANTVLPHVKNYIDELHIAFSGRSLPIALASYVFLEKSAIDSYGPLYETISRALPNLSQDDLEFFSMHAILEQEHEKAARQLVEKQCFNQAQCNEYDKQYHHLASCWDLFWQDIYQETMRDKCAE